MKQRSPIEIWFNLPKSARFYGFFSVKTVPTPRFPPVFSGLLATHL